MDVKHSGNAFGFVEIVITIQNLFLSQTLLLPFADKSLSNFNMRSVSLCHSMRAGNYVIGSNHKIICSYQISAVEILSMGLIDNARNNMPRGDHLTKKTRWYAGTMTKSRAGSAYNQNSKSRSDIVQTSIRLCIMSQYLDFQLSYFR